MLTILTSQLLVKGVSNIVFFIYIYLKPWTPDFFTKFSYIKISNYALSLSLSIIILHSWVDERQTKYMKAMENFPLLYELLNIGKCEDLDRISNHPQVTKLCVQGTRKIRPVDGLGSLQQVWLCTSTTCRQTAIARTLCFHMQAGAIPVLHLMYCLAQCHLHS
jgi:hypothetical protein